MLPGRNFRLYNQLMKSKLDSLEARLQALIENRFAWIDLRGNQPRLGRPVVEALRTQILGAAEENQPLPNVAVIAMHPENTTAWNAHPEWLTWLEQTLQQIVSQAGYNFLSPLEFRLRPETSLNKKIVQVETYFSHGDIDSTAALIGITDLDRSTPSAAEATCYLILNGDNYYPLIDAVINLGRREDNHLIFDDPRVSRSHAQIRKVHNKFVLFDLDSTGGTFVNGNRISQYTLQPGDVISLAGVAIIYGEEIPKDDSQGGTAPTEYT